MRVGGSSTRPALMPALAHIRATASGAAARSSCKMIWLRVRYQPGSLARTLPSCPTSRITPENTSAPPLTMRSLSPGAMLYQWAYLSFRLFRRAVKLTSTLSASSSSRSSTEVVAAVMSRHVLPWYKMTR